MKKYYIALCVFIFSVTIFAEKPAVIIQHWDLKNKTRVFFVRRTELPMLDVKLIFTAGSAFDDKEPGLSALTNAMIGEGTGSLTSDDIARTFDKVGAQFSTFEDRDMAGATLRTLTDPNYLQEASRLFSLVISAPIFSEKELTRVKQQLIAKSQSQRQDPWQIASLEFFSQLYKNNFYAHNPLGTEEIMRTLNTKQLNIFYRRYYTGSNANLILVGNITEDDAKKIAQEIAGNIPEGRPASILSMAPNVAQPIYKFLDYPLSQSTIIMGQVGITRENPDYFSLMVGNAILGGSQSSLLFEGVRNERGLAYSASSAFLPLQYRGPFLIALQTKSASTEEALQLSKKILMNFVTNGPTEKQLQAAKQNLIENFPLTLSSNQNILDLVSKVAFYHRPLDFLTTYPEKISVVTQMDVKKAFQKNINLNKLVTVVVGKKS